jgi:hypothetical protein
MEKKIVPRIEFSSNLGSSSNLIYKNDNYHFAREKHFFIFLFFSLKMSRAYVGLIINQPVDQWLMHQPIAV